jgi:hypothetical protein
MKRSIWREAFRVIPAVSPEEWRGVGPVTRWLISTRAAVLLMRLLSCLTAGLLALREGVFRPLPWALLTVGLLLGHAANNLFNDYVDFRRGVDTEDYMRTRYGPQPVTQGLLRPRLRAPLHYPERIPGALGLPSFTPAITRPQMVGPNPGQRPAWTDRKSLRPGGSCPLAHQEACPGAPAGPGSAGDHKGGA